VAFAFFSTSALDFFLWPSEPELLKESRLLFDHFGIKASDELVSVDGGTAAHFPVAGAGLPVLGGASLVRSPFGCCVSFFLSPSGRFANFVLPPFGCFLLSPSCLFCSPSHFLFFPHQMMMMGIR
jgi:hypothetical protein